MRKRKTTEQAEALVMAVRTILKELEKNAPVTQVKRDGLAITVERRGTSSGIALRHLSCPRPLAPYPICKGPHWKRDCPQKRRF